MGLSLVRLQQGKNLLPLCGAQPIQSLRSIFHKHTVEARGSSTFTFINEFIPLVITLRYALKLVKEIESECKLA